MFIEGILPKFVVRKIVFSESAKELLRNSNPFELRVTATRLETIVSKYNTIIRTMTQFEKPLFERKLAKIDIVSTEQFN